MTGSVEIIIDRWDEIPELARAAARVGLTDAAGDLLGDARALVPIEEGTLERSGDYAVSPANFEAVVYFDTPYAIVQHEDSSLRHDPGRSDKYLEKPFIRNSDRYIDWIRSAIDGALS